MFFSCAGGTAVVRSLEIPKSSYYQLLNNIIYLVTICYPSWSILCCLCFNAFLVHQKYISWNQWVEFVKSHTSLSNRTPPQRTAKTSHPWTARRPERDSPSVVSRVNKWPKHTKTMTGWWLMMMVIIWLMMVNHNLVGGWPTHLKNICDSQLGWLFPTVWKNKTCSKPPRWVEANEQSKNQKPSQMFKSSARKQNWGANWCFLFAWTFEMFRILPPNGGWPVRGSVDSSLTSGYVKIAIEHGHRNSEFSH